MRAQPAQGQLQLLAYSRSRWNRREEKDSAQLLQGYDARLQVGWLQAGGWAQRVGTNQRQRYVPGDANGIYHFT